MKIASDANFGILRFWHFAVSQSAKLWIEPVAAARSSRAVGLQRPSRVPFRISWTWSLTKELLAPGTADGSAGSSDGRTVTTVLASEVEVLDFEMNPRSRAA